MVEGEVGWGSAPYTEREQLTEKHRISARLHAWGTEMSPWWVPNCTEKGMGSNQT